MELTSGLGDAAGYSVAETLHPRFRHTQSAAALRRLDDQGERQ